MSRVLRDFSIEDLEEEYDLPFGGETSFKRGDKHRWYTICEVVFKAKDGNYYMVDYMEPASEMQEGQDRWFDHDGFVTGTQVEPKEVTTIKWVPVVS